MTKIIDKTIFYLKIFFLLIAFSFTLYISLMKMDTASSNMLTILPIFIPFLILLIIFVAGLFFDWKESNIYSNLISILALIPIIVITLRTIFDKNIIPYPAGINLGYYNMLEGKIKMLLYLMIIGNTCLLYRQKIKKPKIHS